MIPAFFMANRRGIPRIESIGVSATSSAVTFNFRRHPYESINFSDVLLVYLAQPVPTTAAGTETINIGTIPLKGFNDENVTASEIRGTGLYLMYYDSSRNYLQLLTGYASASNVTTI